MTPLCKWPFDHLILRVILGRGILGARGFFPVVGCETAAEPRSGNEREKNPLVTAVTNRTSM